MKAQDQARRGFEELEVRRLLTITANPQPSPTEVSQPYTPDEIKAAYGIDNISFGGVGSTIQGLGEGQTIAILGYGDDPNLVPEGWTPTPTYPKTFGQSDLGLFDGKYPPPTELASFFTVVNSTGSTAREHGAGWGQTSSETIEDALDVEWAHVMAPYANIVLIEVENLVTTASLETAVTVGVPATHADVVNMSFVYPNDYNIPLVPEAAFNQPGVTFVGASGDNGAPSFGPGDYPDVVDVGATDLALNTDGSTTTFSGTPESIASYQSEIGWSDPSNGPTGNNDGGSGGGYTTYPASSAPYQKGVVIHDGNQIISNDNLRTTPDISFVGGSQSTTSGAVVAVANGQNISVSGTSVAAPNIAALIAIADQGIADAGGAPMDSLQTLAAMYAMPASDYHQITSGYNGFSAGAGAETSSPQTAASINYNLVAGLGSPIANQWVPDLARAATLEESLAAPVPAWLTYEAPEFYYTNPLTGITATTPSPNYLTLTLGTIAGVPTIEIFNSNTKTSLGTLVAQSPLIATAAITINGGDFSANSLTINFSGGDMIPGGNGLTFDGQSFEGGPESNEGNASLTIQGSLPAGTAGTTSSGKTLTSVWNGEVNRPLSPNSGFFEFGTLSSAVLATVNYLNMGAAAVLPAIIDTTPAANVSYTVLGNNVIKPINLLKGQTVNGAATTQVSSATDLFIPVDFNSKTNLTVTDSDGNDSLLMDFTSGNPLPAAGMTFNGGTGVNTVTVVGGGNFTLGANATVTNTTLGGGGLSLLNEQSITVNGTTGAQYFTVAGWAIPVTIDGGNGEDQIYVRQNASFTVNDSTITSTAGLALTMENINYLELYNSTSGGTFTVNKFTKSDALGLYLIGSSGNNNFVIGSATSTGINGGLDAITSPVTVIATGGKANSLTLNDQLNSSFVDYSVTQSKITSTYNVVLQGGGPRPFAGITIENFAGNMPPTVIQSVTLNANENGSTFNVTPNTTTTYNINATASPPSLNTLNIPAVGPQSPTLFVTSGSTFVQNSFTNNSGLFMFANDKGVSFKNIQATNFTGSVGSINAVSATAGSASQPIVNIINSVTGQILQTINLGIYPLGYTGGIQTALGDVTGDGIPDLIVAPGVGTAPVVGVYNILTGQLIQSFMAQASTFNYGLRVAVGDVTGDGKQDLITAPLVGAANVSIFANTGSATAPFSTWTSSTPTIKAFSNITGYMGGAGGLAVGNLTNNAVTTKDPGGVGDIVVGSGVGTAAAAQVFNYSANKTSSTPVLTVTPLFSASVNGGLSVAVADVTGDGTPDLVMGAGTGAASQVDVYNGKTKAQNQFTAFTGAGNTAALHVAIAKINGVNDIIVAQNTGGQSHQLKTFTATGTAVGTAFAETESWLQGGINLD